MELFYLLIGAVIGAIAGFVVTKKLSASEQEFDKLEQQVNESKTSLEQYKQEVAVHLDNSAQLLAQMNETCQAAMTQMEKSTLLLNKANEESNAMPFFSKETEEQIRSKQKTKPSRVRKSEPLTEPPLDYSSDPSGLFNDKKQIVTNSPS